MSLDAETLKKIARLSRLSIADDQSTALGHGINEILTLVNRLEQVDTQSVAPLAHPLEFVQPLREDEVTETDQRGQLQSLSGATEDGLYLVPKVIE